MEAWFSRARRGHGSAGLGRGVVQQGWVGVWFSRAGWECGSAGLGGGVVQQGWVGAWFSRAGWGRGSAGLGGGVVQQGRWGHGSAGQVGAWGGLIASLPHPLPLGSFLSLMDHLVYGDRSALKFLNVALLSAVGGSMFA